MPPNAREALHQLVHVLSDHDFSIVVREITDEKVKGEIDEVVSKCNGCSHRLFEICEGRTPLDPTQKKLVAKMTVQFLRVLNQKVQ